MLISSGFQDMVFVRAGTALRLTVKGKQKVMFPDTRLGY